MQSISGKIGISTAQLTLAWLLSNNICVIPKSNSKPQQEKNFASKDAIYSLLPFSAEIDNISTLCYPLPTRYSDKGERRRRQAELELIIFWCILFSSYSLYSSYMLFSYLTFVRAKINVNSINKVNFCFSKV